MCRGKGRRGGDFFFSWCIPNKRTEGLDDSVVTMLSGDQEIYCCFLATRDLLISGIWENNKCSCSSLSNIQLLQQRTLYNTLNTISYLYTYFCKLSPNTFWYSAPWRHYHTSSLLHILLCRKASPKLKIHPLLILTLCIFREVFLSSVFPFSSNYSQAHD